MRTVPLPFLAASAADLALAASSGAGARRLRRYTKPLLMPALARWVHSQRPGRPDAMTRHTLTALRLSAVGDVALLRDDDAGFLGGIGAFLGAHVAYVAAFSGRRGSRGAAGTLRRTAPTGAAWVLTVPPLAARAGPLRAPVAVYGTAIAAMQASALLLDERVPSAARTRITAGATVFMVSDLLIALQRFVLPRRCSRAADVGVMATYLTAQWLIADGVLRAGGR